MRRPGKSKRKGRPFGFYTITQFYIWEAGFYNEVFVGNHLDCENRGCIGRLRGLSDIGSAMSGYFVAWTYIVRLFWRPADRGSARICVPLEWLGLGYLMGADSDAGMGDDYSEQRWLGLFRGICLPVSTVCCSMMRMNWTRQHFSIQYSFVNIGSLSGPLFAILRYNKDCSR